MSEHENNCASRAEDVGARDSEKNVTHVHHARVAEHPVEPLLRDRDQADVNDVPEQQHDEKIGPVTRALRQQAEWRDAADRRARIF